MWNDAFYANGKERAGIEAVQRMQAVKRWHMIDTTRPQSLAEHSANVALLAWYIATSAPGMHFGPGDPIASLALRHDLAEVFTGDIPSHSKRHLTGLGTLEQIVLPKVFQEENVPIDTYLLIKLCDLADGIRFVRLHGVDITSEHAAEGLYKQLDAKLAEATRWPAPVLHYVTDAIRFYAFTK